MFKLESLKFSFFAFFTNLIVLKFIGTSFPYEAYSVLISLSIFLILNFELFRLQPFSKHDLNVLSILLYLIIFRLTFLIPRTVYFEKSEEPNLILVYNWLLLHKLVDRYLFRWKTGETSISNYKTFPHINIIISIS